METERLVTRCCVLGALSFLLCGPVLTWPAVGQEPDSVAAADSLLLEIQRRMGAFEATDERPASAVRTRPTTNPDISVIGDIRGMYVSEGDRNVDMEVHEVETAFKSVVDPFARADVYVSAHNEDGEIHFELEEAYLTTLALPAGLQIRAGKFRSTVGKLNRIHPHALPFPDMPSVYENFFGHEGLNDQGVGLSWLLPNSRFYQELTVEVTRGPGENPSFEASHENRLLYVGHLKNFWDLSRDATIELGATAISGPNAAGHETFIGGFDATFIWKPVRFNTYHSLLLQAEALFSRMDTGDEEIATNGFYALANWQLSQRWFLIGRFDHADIPDDAGWNENGLTAAVALYLTEFQKFELGFRRSWADHFDAVHSGVLRIIFVIGTHGAHEY